MTMQYADIMAFLQGISRPQFELLYHTSAVKKTFFACNGGELSIDYEV